MQEFRFPFLCDADHDMIYLEPFRGHKEIRQYFEKVVSIVPPDLKFTVEDITDGDLRKVGVKWCVPSELDGSALKILTCKMHMHAFWNAWFTPHLFHLMSGWRCLGIISSVFSVFGWTSSPGKAVALHAQACGGGRE